MNREDLKKAAMLDDELTKLEEQFRSMSGIGTSSVEVSINSKKVTSFRFKNGEQALGLLKGMVKGQIQSKTKELNELIGNVEVTQ